jgi:hypothetical protein
MNSQYYTVVLAAGSKRFNLENGQMISKLEFDVSGARLIDRALSSLNKGFIRLVISEDESCEFSILNEIDICKVGSTKGALITAILGLRDCDLSLPLVICPGDALLKEGKFQEFIKETEVSDSEISLIVFNSDNPNYSYIRTIDDVMVEVCEKKVISSVATTGFIYYKSAQLFLDCAEWAIMNNVCTNDSFFVAPSLNYAVIIGSNPSLFQIDESDYYRFSNPDEAHESEVRYKNAI